MGRGDLENSDLSWLKSMMKNELDLRPPSLVRTNQTSKVIRDEQGNPIATLQSLTDGKDLKSTL